MRSRNGPLSNQHKGMNWSLCFQPYILSSQPKGNQNSPAKKFQPLTPLLVTRALISCIYPAVSGFLIVTAPHSILFKAVRDLKGQRGGGAQKNPAHRWAMRRGTDAFHGCNEL